MGRMDIFNAVCTVPENAKRPITGGRLKGMTEINPMWRIRVLTEVFGPCGIGWWYTIDKQWLEPGENGEIKAFCNISLFYRNGDTVSQAIPGTGGADFLTNEKNGPYTSDEAYKMALTDAISVAAKALGVGASVYWSAKTKYSTGDQQESTGKATPPKAQIQSGNPKDEGKRKDGGNADLICAVCGKEVSGKVAAFSRDKYKKCLCMSCQKKVGNG